MKRATTAAKIRHAGSEQSSHDIAYWGRVLTPLERCMNDWLAHQGMLKRLHTSAAQKSRRDLERWIAESQSKLQSLFLEAVRKLDSETLRQLADHMDGMTPDYRSKTLVADRLRAQLLTMKEIYPAGFTLAKLAGLICYNGELSRLSKTAKDVGFPLIKSRTSKQ